MRFIKETPQGDVVIKDFGPHEDAAAFIRQYFGNNIEREGAVHFLINSGIYVSEDLTTYRYHL